MDRWSHMWSDSKMCHQDSPSRKDLSNCQQCGLQPPAVSSSAAKSCLSEGHCIQWRSNEGIQRPRFIQMLTTLMQHFTAELSAGLVIILLRLHCSLPFPSVQPCFFLFLFIGFWALLNSVCPNSTPASASREADDRAHCKETYELGK